MNGRAALLVALGAMTPVHPAKAQQVAASGRTIYEAAFFQAYSPANALQIVERVWPSARWTMTLGAKNLTDKGVLWHRYFYQPDRTRPAAYLYEERDRGRWRFLSRA